MVHHNFWCAPEYLSEEGRGKPSQTPKFFPALPEFFHFGIFRFFYAPPTPILGCAVALKCRKSIYNQCFIDVWSEDAAAKEEWEWGIEMLEVSTMVLWGRGRENFGV